MYDLARKKHDLCRGVKGSRKKRSAFNFFFFLNVKKPGFIFGSFLFLKVIIVSKHHEYWLGFQVWVPTSSDKCLTSCGFF